MSQHVDTDEAIERAISEGPGTYDLIPARKRIVVTSPAPLPAPQPEPTPTPQPIPDPAPQPAPAPPVLLSAVGMFSLASDGLVLRNGELVENYWHGQPAFIYARGFLERHGTIYASGIIDARWFGWNGSAWLLAETGPDGLPLPIVAASVPLPGSGTPAPGQSAPLFPLPDPLPTVPVVNANPTRLRLADITPVLDPATGEPWYADISLEKDPGVFETLGYFSNFKLRRVNGELRAICVRGETWGAPIQGREISLSNLQHGSLNFVRYVNSWALTGDQATFGDFIGLQVDGNRLRLCGSMDYVTHQVATIFECTLGPNGQVSDIVSYPLGAFYEHPDKGRLVEGLNGKECSGTFVRTPQWLQNRGVAPVLILDGKYTSLVGAAATASMGLFAAAYLPQKGDGVVPVQILADHRSGSVTDDWATPLTQQGTPKQTYAPGTQPFDRGRCLPGMVQNWLDGNIAIANASRTTIYKVNVDRDVCTIIEGPPAEPRDMASPLLPMFDWWREGVRVLQHGQWVEYVPDSHLEIAGQMQTVRFVAGLDDLHFRIDRDLGTHEGVYFYGPRAEDFYRQVGFDDRNQWNGTFPDGFGRWSWGTGYLGGLLLIDGPRKGILGLYNGGLGQTFYDHSTFQHDTRIAEWHVYDLDELGTRPPHMVQPAEIALDRTLTDDMRAFGKSKSTLPWGQWIPAYDEETGEIYTFGPLMAHSITSGQVRVRKFRVNE